MLHGAVAEARGHTWRTKRSPQFAAPTLATNFEVHVSHPLWGFILETSFCFLHPCRLEKRTRPSFAWGSYCTSVPAAVEQNLETTDLDLPPVFVNKVLLAPSHGSLRTCCLELLWLLSCYNGRVADRPSGPQS